MLHFKSEKPKLNDCKLTVWSKHNFNLFVKHIELDTVNVILNLKVKDRKTFIIIFVNLVYFDCLFKSFTLLNYM